jgi:hypothetical protein
MSMSQSVKKNAEKNMQDLANMANDHTGSNISGSDYQDSEEKRKISSTMLKNIKKIQESTEKHDMSNINTKGPKYQDG